MSKDFTYDLIQSALEDHVKRLMASGLSAEEIQARVEAINLDKATSTVIEQMTNDCVSSIYERMYEYVMFERSRAAEFMVHNEQLWQPGFVTSEMMYLIAIEAAESYCKIFEELPDERKQELQYRFVVLKELHGRACQEFSEILCLLKFGFADGAYARWRSMYELSVVAQFIRQNGEEIAKAYYESSFDDRKEYEWAKSAPCFADKKCVSFNMLQQQCDMATEQWQKQYRLSNKVLHATPQGTFARLGVRSDVRIVAVGHSDYGIAAPAINSAITLAVISSFFLDLFSSGDGTVYSIVITKWCDTVKERYSKIEESCFNSDEIKVY